MKIQRVEEVVQSLVVALMNSRLYFPRHRRVVEAAEDAVRFLDELLTERKVLCLGIREDLFVVDNLILYDLSIYANRLVKAVQEHGGTGLRLEAGMTTEEVIRLMEVLVEPVVGSPDQTHADLQKQGITRIRFAETVLTETGSGEVLQETECRIPSMDHRFSRDLYVGAMSSLEEVMQDLREDRRVDLDAVKEAAEGIAQSMQSDRDSLLALTAVKDYDDYTYNHSVNVCIYATALAEKLTRSREEVVNIAQAALLHDVGKMLIPDEVLFKTQALSMAEFDVMKQHTVLGAMMLMEVEGAEELAINAAFCHHLRFDGDGYPDLSFPFSPDPVSQLIHVIDVYEAITAKRPYKKPFPPERATNILLSGAGADFNPVCVEAFLDHFGVYLPGTRVRLDTGATAEVVSCRPGAPFQPLVRLTHGPDGHPLEDQELIDCAKHDPAGQNSCRIETSLV